ncbi:hypothetical protein Cycma_1661 [Cyclobacterium marinum DSM 745]|uniref:Zinc-finger domain-containing protein n=2 Tax=Cyclobacterium marinum TaxID=104 RepID=G0J5W4_CYCMS|nr:hypothetical protein Cycma_1661 [Cyclobacterium marinum DSM 745]|tara:strand:- start:4623 stop:4889 length:267 start_codon:yes stop_codon:yes gene_type:complete
MIMEKLMSRMLLSCKEATYLVEKQMESPLTIMEKFRLNIHLRLCKVCNAYQHQSETINIALKKWTEESVMSKELPSEVKSEILKEINR